MLSWLHCLAVLAVAFAVTALAVPPVRRFAISHDIVDKPGPRRVNRTPIPRMGGLAMYAGLVGALLFECAGEALGLWAGFFVGAAANPSGTVCVLVSVTAIVVLGVLDDIWSLKPGVKFFGQVLCACIVAAGGVLIENFHVPFSSSVVSLGLLAYPLTVIYLVCFVNIINLIDGLDGLAAGISAIAALALLVMVLSLGCADASLLAVMLVGMCLGFLLYNFHPASIFMGDSGSMMLGLVLGSISLLGATRFASVTVMLVPVVVALVPVMDTLGAIIRRARRHESITTADAGHIHHRLLLRGYSQSKVVLIVYAWTAVLSIGAIVMWEFGGAVKYTVLTVLFAVSAVIVWRLGLFGPIRTRMGRPDVHYETYAERVARREADASQARPDHTEPPPVTGPMRAVHPGAGKSGPTGRHSRGTRRG